MSRVPPMGIRTPDEHDWIEDFSHENGGYQRACDECGKDFLGHKRRTTCKVCVLSHLSAFKMTNLCRTHWFPVGGWRMPEDRQLVQVYYPERTIDGCTYAASRDITRYYKDEEYGPDEVDTLGFYYSGDVGDCAPAYWAYVLDEPCPENILDMTMAIDWADPNTKDCTP